jgi:small GTP-binding protein
LSDESYIFKILVCGPASVGKTCLVHRYVDNVFIEDTQSTIGVDFSLKNIQIDPSSSSSTSVILQLWDLAGEEAFREILPYYVQGSHGVIFVFDINSPSSLVDLQEWVDFVKPLLLPKTPCALISTKHDLEEIIDENKVLNFRKKNDLSDYYATSSKTNLNVHETFVALAKMIYEIHKY